VQIYLLIKPDRKGEIFIRKKCLPLMGISRQR